MNCYGNFVISTIQFVFMLLLAPNIMLESAPFSITTDKEALIAFQSLISVEVPNPLSTWDKNLSPCNWSGVSCNQNGHRVVGLHLPGLRMTGPISPSLGNLSFLRSLDLQNNHFTGDLPHQLGMLLQLRTLNLSFNTIQGVVPSNLSRCQHLRVLDLRQNQISGKIPQEISLLKRLQLLNLGGNQLSGDFPSFLANVSSLVELNLGTNHFSGPMPGDLGRLASLKILDLTINNLSGTVPPSIYNISSLEYLALASNGFWGDLPGGIASTLPNLSGFNFCFNKFTGRIPWSLHNLTNMKIIRMAHNLLHGTIPPGLGNLPNLEMYNIGFNSIQGSLDFLQLLTNSTRLSFLAVDFNLLEGAIPSSIGNLSKDHLAKFYMGGNYIYGTVPSSIGELRALELLNLSYTSISGPIPFEIGLLKELRVVGLADNMLSGIIPESLGNLRMLTKIDLSKNKLVGSIPKTFGKLRELISIDLSDNNLNGSLPIEIFNLPRLSAFLNLSQNQLTGPLPVEIGLLENIAIINISDNKLSGDIPRSVGDCKSLETLLLSRNMFSGPIPDTLGSVRGLETLDLSSNQLSGEIPLHLQNLQSLQLLNLSFNNLEGEIPKMGVFADPSKVHLESNRNLYSSESHRHRDRLTIIYAVISVATVASLCFAIALLWYKRKGKGAIKDSFEAMKVQPEMISYDALRAATDGFNEENLIGHGSFGFVYKGLLELGETIAVKVLDATVAGSRRSFLAECAALRNVRHRNLVKLRTVCSSINSKNEEFLALIYEFMSNGSLDDWISGKRRHGDGMRMNVLERLRCAVGIASAMEYLHNQTEVPIVHCDLKPGNVLLDSDMTPKVADFGLAKLLQLDASDQTSLSYTHTLRGSLGYIPPEYGYGVRPTSAGDMYSYGILVLELFTGRAPTDEIFRGGTSLKSWVEMQYPTNVEQVVDPHIVDQMRGHSSTVGDCVVAVLGVGLSCAAQSPDARLTITDALRKLHKVEEMLMS